jgi:calcineurin-like phosphoesterase family protein
MTLRIRLLSDLHMEGYAYYYEYAGEDIVVLAGDIHTMGKHGFILDQIPINVKILLVAGNHEYYGGIFEEVNAKLKELENTYHNLTFLNNSFTKIDNVDFFGGTMFTDFSLYEDSWTAKQFAKNGIADFHWIDTIGKNGKRFWNPEDHAEQHEIYKEKLEAWKTKIAGNGKRVVISHFVPTPAHIHPKFEGSRLNPYFTVDMETHMNDVDLWLHGHTHDSFDTYIGNCRVVCNPKGYGKENVNGFINNLIIDI